MGIVAIAEGIEVSEERDTVARLGCDLQQGFLFPRSRLAGLTIGTRCAAFHRSGHSCQLSPSHTFIWQPPLGGVQIRPAELHLADFAAV
jgi:EAL domain-containing protein (putative c-di-GMP-specific phosphodiesterase class I)